VIGYTLRPAVYRVESMTGKWRWHDPLVMWLMQSLVNHRMMQASVNPVNEAIRKEYEERELKDVVERERGICRRVVEFGIAANLSEEERHGEESYAGHRTRRLLDF